MNKINLKTNQDHPQIKAYKNAIEKGLKSHHVLPHENSWVVKRAGAARVSGIYDTQSDAVTAAKIIAKNNNSEVFIHGKDGRIRERI